MFFDELTLNIVSSELLREFTSPREFPNKDKRGLRLHLDRWGKDQNKI